MSMFLLMAWMKWFPPMAKASPSPLTCQMQRSGLATFIPVAIAVARPWMLWNP